LADYYGKLKQRTTLPRDDEMILPVLKRYPMADVLKLLWMVVGGSVLLLTNWL
jgi:hypothetical protein